MAGWGWTTVAVGSQSAYPVTREPAGIPPRLDVSVRGVVSNLLFSRSEGPGWLSPIT